MYDSWLSPTLLEKIANNVPFLQRALLALVKQDPSSIADVPAGAKRLTEISQGKWQLQQFNGTSWESLGKLMMDVDTLDTYHAALTPQKNTIPVRDANGDLPGNIIGNANTANSAQTLSAVLETALGGTGATTSAQARTNLGVPPTSHASSSTTYGLGSNINYGHVRGDGETTNIVAGEVVVKDVAIGGDVNDLASKRGQIGKDYLLPDGGNLNDLRTPGNYGVRGATWENVPEKTYARIQVMNGAIQSSGFVGGLTQLWCTIGQQYVHWFYRSFVYSTQTWSDWVKFVDETDLATTTTPGIVTIDKKNFTTGVREGGEFYVECSPKQLSYNVAGNEFSYQDVCASYRLENGSSGNSRVFTLRAEAGVGYNGAALFSTNQDTNSFGACFRVYDYKSGTKLCFTNCDFSVNNGNGIVNASNVLQTGDLVASFASSKKGCLLCNGAAVSRTTYANLFAILGTAFGEGDGSTTFNLPDFRDKTLWGANGNLMSILTAGLPNIEGGLSIGALCQNGSGAIRVKSSGVLRASTDASNSSGFNFNASKSNNIYGKSTTVQPPAIAVNLFIKY